MKKFLSLLLVLVMLLSFAPAAYADSNEKALDSVEDLILFLLKVYAYPGNVSEGIVKSDGHLFSCSGGDCSCLAIIEQALKEDFEARRAEALKVWIKTTRDDDGTKHDLVVTEVEVAHDLEGVDENQAYLDGKEAVAKLFEDFFDADEQAENLYRPGAFLHSQVSGSINYISAERSSSKIHVEYRLMERGPSQLDGYGIAMLDKDADDESIRNFIFCRDALESGDELIMHVGNLIMVLPEECKDEAFNMGLSFMENGSVRVLLVDDNGKAIPGAKIGTALPEGADDKTVAAVLGADGSTSPIEDSVVEDGYVSFTAPSGDDVFVLE